MTHPRKRPEQNDLTPLLKTVGLGKRYHDLVAVEQLDLEVYPGEILALLGPNGAGKTTTLRMLTGLLKPTSGTARICDLDCFSERAAVQRYLGYLPDEPTYYDYLTGRELVEFAARMRGLDLGSVMQRIQPLVERFDLAEAWHDYAVNYSKGMKKKLALILAVLHEPRLLILDEPTNGLDPFATRALHEWMRDRSAQGVACLFSTHLLDQAERLCHRVAIITKGRLAAVGRLAELREQMKHDGSLEELFFQIAGDGHDEPGRPADGSPAPVPAASAAEPAAPPTPGSEPP